MPRAFSLSGFEVTLIGRFWVTTEAISDIAAHSTIPLLPGKQIVRTRPVMSEIYSSDSIRASELPQASVTAGTRSASPGLGGAAAVAATGGRPVQQVYLGFLNSSLSLLQFT